MVHKIRRPPTGKQFQITLSNDIVAVRTSERYMICGRPDSKKIQRLYSSALRLPLALPNLDAAATDITHLLHRRKHQIPYPFSAI